MQLELLNTLAAVGTFLVIAATAIAAVVQLRHLRAGNQLSSFMTIGRDFDRPEFLKILAYVRNELPAKMKDPRYRSEILAEGGYDRVNHPEAIVCGYFEQIGLLVKLGVAEERVFLDAFSPLIVSNWERLAPFISICRELSGPSAWENFEYVAARAYCWIEQHPNGTLPKTFRRLPLDISARTSKESL